MIKEKCEFCEFWWSTKNVNFANFDDKRKTWILRILMIKKDLNFANYAKMDSKKNLKEFENSFLKINSRFKLHKFEFSILKWHFKTKIWKIWNFHFQNPISDFILKNFPMFIPEIPIFNLKIRVWHFWTIFGGNRMSKTKHRIWRERQQQQHAKHVVNTPSKSNLQNHRQNPGKIRIIIII